MASNEHPFPIPPQVSSLMPQSRQEALAAFQQRSVSTASRISRISQTSNESMVSDFMEAQINSLEDEKAYIQCFREGLDEARDAGKLSDRRLHQEIAPYLRRIRKTSGTLKVLKRQKKVLTEDLQEEMAIKKKRSNTSPDEGLLRRAYRDTIVPRVMGAVTKVAERKFNQRRFKKGVEKHYGIREHCPKGYSWCHVLGRYEPAATVKAAHLVPKSLTDDEVAHLFGGEHKVQCDPQNGLTLSWGLELLMDQGAFVIVPIPGELTIPTTWRCIVLNEAKRGEIVGMKDSGAITLGDIDGQELKFLTDNRPRRRYLYFRFIISYLNVKKMGLENATAKMESRKFWPSGGEYLHRSTLQTLARCVSGGDIPEDLIEGNTFNGPNDPCLDSEMGMIVGAAPECHGGRQSTSGPDVREALLASMAQLKTET